MPEAQQQNQPEDQQESVEANPPKSIKEVNAQMAADNAANSERMDNLEAQLGSMENGINDKFEAMMNALNAMGPQGAVGGATAQASVGGIRDHFKAPPGTDAGAVSDQQTTVEWDHATNEHSQIEVIQGDVNDPLFQKKAKDLEFYAQCLTIHVETTNDPHESKIFPVATNGKQFIFERGETYPNIPRYIVENILVSRPWEINDEVYYDDEGVKKHRNPVTVGSRHPISIVYDPSPDLTAQWYTDCVQRQQ